MFAQLTPSPGRGVLHRQIRANWLQDYRNLEYIIIDGGSSDQNVEIIRKYESSLTYCVSERDKG
jgi:cellulose synthase/poly-beta-1,6-N-acetylglucosamine synthase-like glycosyltransferase